MAVVPPALLSRVRQICLALPGSSEEAAWIGVRWRVRGRTFAHLISVDDAGSSVLRRMPDLRGEVSVVTFHVPADEVEALRRAGPPFHHAGWGHHVMALQLDDGTDWSEVAELLVESFCLLAPQKLVALVDRPSTDD